MKEIKGKHQKISYEVLERPKHGWIVRVVLETFIDDLLEVIIVEIRNYKKSDIQEQGISMGEKNVSKIKKLLDSIKHTHKAVLTTYKF